jgi:DNA-binding response OmpR family regulator
VWEADRDSLANLVDVHVSHLRRKIDRAGVPPLIRTVWGHGYRLGPPSS